MAFDTFSYSFQGSIANLMTAGIIYLFNMINVTQQATKLSVLAFSVFAFNGDPLIKCAPIEDIRQPISNRLQLKLFPRHLQPFIDICQIFCNQSVRIDMTRNRLANYFYFIQLRRLFDENMVGTGRSA